MPAQEAPMGPPRKFYQAESSLRVWCIAATIMMAPEEGLSLSLSLPWRIRSLPAREFANDKRLEVRVKINIILTLLIRLSLGRHALPLPAVENCDELCKVYRPFDDMFPCFLAISFLPK